MKNTSNLVHLMFSKWDRRSSSDNINMNCRQLFQIFSQHASNCIRLSQALHLPGTSRIASLRPLVTLSPCFTVNIFNFLLYSPIFALLNIPNFTSSIMKPTASQVRNHYSQTNLEAHLERARAHAFMNTANHHCRSNVGTSNPALWYSVGDS